MQNLHICSNSYSASFWRARLVRHPSKRGAWNLFARVTRMATESCASLAGRHKVGLCVGKRRGAQPVEHGVTVVGSDSCLKLGSVFEVLS